MNIVVCLKQTFDTEERIEVEEGRVVEDGVTYVINPYDEYAVEEAIRLKEEYGGDVTVVTVGSPPDRVEQSIRTALAMGADRGVIVDDESRCGDAHATAKMLAAVIKNLEHDLILTGYMSIDEGSAQLGPRLAEELDIPHISTITDLDVRENEVKVEKDIEGDVAFIKSSLPLLATAQQGLNEPRYPSLPGIMKAKRKPLDRLSLDDLDVSAADLTAKTETLDIFLPPEKQAVQFLEGEPDDQVQQLVELLRNEAKVI